MDLCITGQRENQEEAVQGEVTVGSANVVGSAAQHVVVVLVGFLLRQIT